MRISIALALSACLLVGCQEGFEDAVLSQLEIQQTPATAPSTTTSPAATTTEKTPIVERPATETLLAETSGEDLAICSFNVQFLGNSRRRDDQALAQILAPYDIVVVQELVSPPYPGQFPGGDSFKPDSESAEFFDAMKHLGFQYVLSEEDTGTGDNIHRNGSSTEWWVTFYKSHRVQPASDLPHGFLASDRSNHPDFERVPYAFAFRTPDGNLDFVLISVHLMPGGGSSDKQRRHQELQAIASWIDAHDDQEHDFIILGDMNIENAEELAHSMPPGFSSLNDECRPTNTNLNGPKPYDHVLYNRTHTTEIDVQYDMKVIDLVNEMRPSWDQSDPYPGDPYDHNAFRAYYSDHHPVVFEIRHAQRDDDGVTRTAATGESTETR